MWGSLRGDIPAPSPYGDATRTEGRAQHLQRGVWGSEPPDQGFCFYR
jgi:hypothetical protein